MYWLENFEQIEAITPIVFWEPLSSSIAHLAWKGCENNENNKTNFTTQFFPFILF